MKDIKDEIIASLQERLKIKEQTISIQKIRLKNYKNMWRN